jgi:CRP/FNR family cyclic AMP-dependent transcriptional regulator
MKRNGVQRIQVALSESPHFRSLSAADLHEIAAIGRVERLNHGEQCSGGLCLILEGTLRLSGVTAQGQEFVVAHLGRGEIAGISAIMPRPTSPFVTHAVDRAVVVVFPGPALRALFDHRPALWRHFAGVIYERLVQTLLLARDVGVVPLPQRLARRLLWQALASSHGAPAHPPIHLSISQTELARMLGAARSVVNGTLRGMERAGALALGYRSVELIDLPALRQIAGPDLPLPN